jgi:dihydrofolate reductase
MKTSVYVGTSLDGFIARKDGDIDWLVKFQNNEVSKSYEEFISRIDTIVIGRGTYETVVNFPSWPYEKKVFVLSTSIKQIPDSLKGKASILSMKPKELLNFLSHEGFSNIYVDGGKVIQDFLKEDCIDELIVTKLPVLIGNGIPLFGDLNNDLQFKHVRTDIYSNGLVKSHYERKK